MSGKGRFYWPSDDYSVPADNLCFHIPPSPDADHRCIRPAGHPGRHQYVIATWGAIRDYSHKDPRP